MAQYGKAAHGKVARALREREEGSLRSGRSGKKVTSRKQAIAIGLSEARRAGAKVPSKKRAAKKVTTKRPSRSAGKRLQLKKSVTTRRSAASNSRFDE